MEIRDTRNGDWHWVYNALLADPHLTAGEKLVYSAISTFGGHQVIHPTKEQLSERCSLDEKTVQRAIKRLEEVGYLRMDKSTGRGNANVYYLLKKSKGCNLCLFPKGGHSDDKGGHLEQEKGTETTPHIDRYKDNKDISETYVSRVVEVSEEEKPTREKKDTTYYEVYRLFADPWPLSWNRNTTQQVSAKNLLKERGLQDCKEALEFYRKHKNDQFCPKINSPYDLDTKWVKLEEHLDRIS